MALTPTYTIFVHSGELAVISKLKQYPEINIKAIQLDVGDFIPSMKVGIERKNGKDFTSSIIDGRLFEELGRLTASYQIPILLIEDFNSAFSNSKIVPQAIYGALCAVILKFRVPILPVPDIEGTALLLRTMVKQLQNPKKKKTEEDSFVPRRNPKFKSIEDEQIFLLKGLRDCKEKAIDLLESLGDPMTIFQMIVDTHPTHIGKKGEEIKGWNIPDNKLTQIKGIGPDFIISNQTLLTTKPNLKPKANLNAQQS